MSTSIAAINRPQVPEGDFVGRETEINLLAKALYSTGTRQAASPRIAVIYGEAGSGKSELARAVIFRTRREFPEGQLSIRYSDIDEVYSAVQYILETVVHSIDPFARIPGSLNELRALYASLLERKRMLIHVGGLVREEAVSLLIPPPTCALLITTPFQLDLPEAYILRSEQLPAVDGEQLLLATSPGLGLLAPELASLCWYSPQALGLCAALLMSESARELADRIREWTEQPSQNDNDEYRRKTLIELLMRQNCERLDKDSRQIFYKLGVFAAGFTQAEAAAATGFLAQAGNNSEALVPHLDSICRLKLLTFDEENKRYRMSDSVRNFAVSHLEESTETYTNLANYYGELAEDCAMLANHGSDGLLLSLLLFDDFKPNFRQIWSWIEKHEPVTPYLDGIILKLSKVIASFGRLRFIPTLELIPYLTVALESAQREKEMEIIASVLGKLGQTHYILGDGHMALEYFEKQHNSVWVSSHPEEEGRILRDISNAKLLLDRSF